MGAWFNMPVYFNARLTWNDKQHFQRRPSSSEWKAFQLLAERVRVFEAPSYTGKIGLSPSSPPILASLLKSDFLFPNVRVLLLGLHDLDTFFMSKSVKELILKCEASRLQGVVVSMAKSMPNISVLRLQFDDIGQQEAALINLVHNLHQLNVLELPLYGLSPTLLQALSGKLHLKVLGMKFNTVVDSMRSPPFAPRSGFQIPSTLFMQPSMQSVQSPALAVPIVETIQNILRRPGLSISLRHMRYLFLRIPFLDEDRNARLAELFQILVDNALSLFSLELWLMESGADNVPSQNISSTAVGHYPLSLLSDIRTLRKLSLYDRLPIACNDNEMGDLSRRYRHLDLLRLNPHPTQNITAQATTVCLGEFAKHSLGLRELAVYINACVVSPPDYSARFSRRFEKLSLGRSQLPRRSQWAETASFAKYISYVVPSDGVQICSGIDDLSTVSRYGDGDTSVHTVPNSVRWKCAFDDSWKYLSPLVSVLRMGCTEEERLYKRYDALVKNLL